ncbi:regulator of microtubule dynamics protein 1 isoform X2 [Channa argus]|uniref:regulator of microtubule dynamics protein 1 isoform X2 n=1 Tax=Channa argus TaxID=215402 RepID=UPI003521CE9C
MAGRVLTSCASRVLLSASRAKCNTIKGPSRHYWTSLRRAATALTSGKAAFLLGLPTFSCLGYKVYHRVQSSTTVHALGKEEVLEQADYLYSCAETEKLYKLLLQYKDSDDAEFLWRLARASRDMSLLPDIEAERKKQLTFEAFEYAKKALEKDDQCFAAHKKAIQLNRKDATSLHILGYWCFAFAELPWYQRKVAAVVFSTPPVSTYEEALEFFLKAEEVDPNFYSKNLLMLGKTYMAMRDRENALLWLTKAKDYPAHTLEDKEVHKEAIDLLKKLG